MLYRSGWAQDTTQPLLDPMCGAGTIAIEAALMAANIAPGLKRERWGFSQWLQHDPSVWQDLIAQAESSIVQANCTILASDIDHGVVSIAKENADAAGIFSAITFNTIDACKVIPPKGTSTGYLVSNPPYGERLSEKNEDQHTGQAKSAKSATIRLAESDAIFQEITALSKEKRQKLRIIALAPHIVESMFEVGAGHQLSLIHI